MSQYIELQARRENARLVIPDSKDPKAVDPITGYAQEPLLPLATACTPLIPIIFNILHYVSIALENTPHYPSDGLTSDESASIYLYTMEWSGGRRSLYTILNETLRTPDREQLKPWFKYLKLLLTALVKIQCASQQTVWRGIRKNLSPEFPRGTQVIWWGLSSCTTTLPSIEISLQYDQSQLNEINQLCDSFQLSTSDTDENLEPIDITLRTFLNQDYKCRIRLDKTINELKEIFGKQENVDPNKIIITKINNYFDEFDNNRTLKSYNCDSTSILMIYLRK
ncbi:unnamed protein product [Rotaria sp. Silwood1]|nr:unnamed protein product [Rotaria sp. Silwood1]